VVTLDDLRSSLQDLLSSKREVAQSEASELPTAFSPREAPQQVAITRAVEAPRAIAVATAVAVQEEEEEEAEVEAEWEAPPEFLWRMEEVLNALGIATEVEITQLLEEGLPAEVLEGLGDLKEVAPKWEMEWRGRMKEKEAVEGAARKRRQRVVWRCSVCKRHGCPLKPVVERMENIDE
jgi:rubrerythrin